MKNNNFLSLVIFIPNNLDINRYIEILFCLKENLDNNNIINIHILHNDIHKETFILEIIIYLSESINSHNKINLHYVDKENLSNNDLFNYCNQNINGITIISNPNIIFNESLNYLNNFENEDFILLNLDNNSILQYAYIFMSPLKYEINNDIIKSLLNTNYRCFNLSKNIILSKIDMNCNKTEENEKYDNDLIINTIDDFIKKKNFSNFCIGNKN